MVKKIAVFTTCRSDMGALTPLIKKIYKEKNIEVLLFVGGTHLAEEHGKTINEIKASGVKVTETFDYLLNEDSSFSLATSNGLAEIRLAYIFQKYDFDFVCLIGDRFERIAIIINAILYKKPIIHIHGGEITSGVIDEQIRHMITKASHIHFVICDEYKKNIKRLGESSWRVHNTGALAIDSIKNIKQIYYKKILKNLNLDENRPFAILTYHPVTLEFRLDIRNQVENVIQALKTANLQVIATSPGIEVGRNEIIEILNKLTRSNNNFTYVKSLGHEILYNLIPFSNFMIGNSSCGMIEVPYYKIPTINIGDRQKGRFCHKSVINTTYSVKSIKAAITKASSKKFLGEIKKMKFGFGDGNAADKMIKIIKKINMDQHLLRKNLD